MHCSHNCQQCACTARHAHVRIQAIEYLNISGLVIDFATSPVRTGNSFFATIPVPTVWYATTRAQLYSIKNSTLVGRLGFGHSFVCRLGSGCGLMPVLSADPCNIYSGTYVRHLQLSCQQPSWISRQHAHHMC